MNEKLNLKLAMQLKSPLLILGESGTGKSTLAKKLHDEYASGPFVNVNVSSIPSSLIESELFGHVRGAFTGAQYDRSGYFELANGGTLFLDEIGELSLSLQTKLLQVIEEFEYWKVGNQKKSRFSGKILLATNRNLEESVKRGKFREDLYYRICGISQYIEPLRSDKNKLAKLIEKFMYQKAQELGLKILRLDSDLLEFMLAYAWPGNIRELKNCIEYFYLLVRQSSCLNRSCLPHWILCEEEKLSLQVGSSSYREAVENFEREYFTRVLNRYAGRVNLAAREIGVSKTTIIEKRKKYGINIYRIKAEREDTLNAI